MTISASMRLLLLSSFSAVLVCAVPLAAVAQEPARPSAASAPAPSKTQPRVQTPTEKRDSATTPGDVRPVDPVIPQVNIPLGRKPAAAESKAEAQRHRKTAAAGGIDDAVARCKAGTSKAARDECLAKLAKQRKVP